MTFWKRSAAPDHIPELGHLESAVMEALWAVGESSVRDLSARLARPLAYTTVMTTLDRMYKKGLLIRRKVERAFLYSPRFSRLEWEQRLAGDMLASLLNSSSTREVLVSNLVDAVGRQDRGLLDELERKISQKRKELEGGGE